MRSILVICLVVVLANSTYILHIFNPNPINQDSGLGTIVQAGVLPGQNNIDPNIGFTSQALGHRAALDWLHGQVPWWDPFQGIGAPLAGGMQPAAFFPLVFLTLLPSGQIYFRLVLEIVAGIGTYLLLRRFTRSNLPAVVAGIAFALNGTFSWLFHAPGNPIAFLPLMLLGLEWAREGALQLRRRGWTLIAVAFALSIYAGFPEVAYIDGLLCVLWLAVRAVGMPRWALARYAQSILFGVVVAILLSAPILVAFVDYIPHADLGAHSGAFAHVSLDAHTALPVQFMPYLFGPIFGFSAKDPQHLTPLWDNIGGFLGASISVLALIGTMGRRYRTLRIALALWIVLGLARLVGVSLALDLINAIPGVKFTAFYRYAPPSWEFALVVLAALGFDDVVHRKTPRSAIIAAGIVMMGLLLLSWHLAQPVFHALSGEPHNHAWAMASLVWALVVTLGIVTVALMPDFALVGVHRGSFRGLALSFLVVLDVLVMFATPQFSAPRQATVDMKPVSYLEHHLGESRFFTLGALSPNYGSYFGISSLAINNIPIPKGFATLIRDHLNTNVDPLLFDGTAMLDPTGPTPAQEFVKNLSAYEAVGVKYVLVPVGMVLPPVQGGALQRVFHDGDTIILKLPHPRPLFESSGSDCTEDPHGETVVSVDCRRPSTITYRQLSMPGWHADSNGRSLPIHSGPSVFQSVVVPAGRSTIEFGFTPPRTTLALLAFVLGLVLLALAWSPSRLLFGRWDSRFGRAPYRR